MSKGFNRKSAQNKEHTGAAGGQGDIVIENDTLGVAGNATTCDSGIPFGQWFKFQVLHF